MSASAPAEPFNDYDGMVVALRRLIDVRGLTYEAVDAICGFQAGYTAKLVGPRQIRALSRMSLSTILQGLAGRMVLENDPEQLEKMLPRYDQRKVIAPMRPMRRIPKATWLIGSRQARILNRKRNEKLTPTQRARLARNAANARWEKQRKTERARRKAARERELLAASLLVSSEQLLLANEQQGDPLTLGGNRVDPV